MSTKSELEERIAKAVADMAQADAVRAKALADRELAMTIWNKSEDKIAQADADWFKARAVWFMAHSALSEEDT